MSGFYELKCVDKNGFHTYYYFYSPRTIRNPKMALNSGYASDGMRLTIVNRDEEPITVRFMNNIFEYIYLKYFKKTENRVNWEKEIKEYLKKD